MLDAISPTLALDLAQVVAVQFGEKDYSRHPAHPPTSVALIHLAGGSVVKATEAEGREVLGQINSDPEQAIS